MIGQSAFHTGRDAKRVVDSVEAATIMNRALGRADIDRADCSGSQLAAPLPLTYRARGDFTLISGSSNTAASNVTAESLTLN